MVGEENWFTDDVIKPFQTELAINLKGSFGEKGSPRLRLSAMGPKCPCQLWHSIHSSHASEPIPAWARIKFSYGHILEALVIAMAKAAGHEVQGEQDELTVDGIVGHRDCVIDGCLVDVKSASSRSFQKFKTGLLAQDDPFGYLDQLDGYLVGSRDDDVVRVKDRGYLLAIDKTLGHLTLYEHRHTEARATALFSRIQQYKRIVDLPAAPVCTCGTVPEGKSGNIKLDVKASYSPFKWQCFPNLRCFLYATGPVYLTKVVRRPAEHIVEVDKNGKIVYN